MRIAKKDNAKRLIEKHCSILNKYNNLDLSQNYTGFLIRFTYPCLQILSLCNTHIWCNLRAQSLHVTNGSLSSISFFFSINSDLLIGLKEY